MKIKRLVLPTLAVVITACASSPDGATVSTSAQPKQTHADSASSQQQLPVDVTRGEKSDAASRSLPAKQAEATQPGAEDDKTNEPRIIRGNDKVINTPKPASPIAAASNSFKFEDAPISEVVHVMMRDILKADYVLHQPVAGGVTLSTKSKVSADQAISMLEGALQANGLLMVRDTRGTYHIGKPDAVKGIGAATRLAVRDGSLPPGYGAIVVPLQYIGAAEMAAILKPMMPAESLVRVDSLRNLLVLAGTRTQAEGWLDLVNTFDVNLLKGMSVGVFPLKYASIKEVEAALALVSGGVGAAAGPTATAGRGGSAPGSAVAPGGAAQPATGGGVPAMLGESNPLFGALRIMPIERLNSVLVVTPRAAYLEEARRWIERLDQPSDNGAEPQLFIYQVQNGNARHLAGVLSGIFGGQTVGTTTGGSSGVAPGLSSATGMSNGQNGVSGTYGSSNAFGNAFSGGTGNSTGRSSSSFANNSINQNSGNTRGNGAQQSVGVNLGSIRVMADDLNNSVLIWGSKSEYQKIEATLKRLDLPPTQVLIEASIVEVTLGDDLEYGLQWAFNDSRANTGYTGSGALNGVGGTATAGILGSALTGFSYSLKNSAGNVRAVLNALSKKTSVKVIASPSLMVLDNHSASIAVGTQTPIQAGTTSNLEGTVTTTNIQYKDTGVNLVVTPSVNAGNIVTMQVDQSVTDVGTKDEVSGQRGFLQRQLSSKVAVRSGESIVMGGLIQERSSTTKSGIPILHSLPVVGNLFGSTAKDGARTELLVVITPRVVRSDIDIREVSDDLRDRMKGLTVFDDSFRDRNETKPSPATPFIQQPR